MTAQQTDTYAALPSLDGKKVLMVWGGWEGHKPKEFTEKIKFIISDIQHISRNLILF